MRPERDYSVVVATPAVAWYKEGLTRRAAPPMGDAPARGLAMSQGALRPPAPLRYHVRLRTRLFVSITALLALLILVVLAAAAVAPARGMRLAVALAALGVGAA